MKQGLTYHLAVDFDGVQLDDVAQVEFAFAACRGGPPVKLDQWPGTVTRKPGTNTLLVPWTAAETYRFSGQLYMDTRITLRDSDDQPVTPIVPLGMMDTLFEEGQP